MKLPDLSLFRLDRVVDDAPAWGVPVPGLRAAFYSRDVGADGRTETVGVYTYDAAEVFLAWGFSDEVHCSGHAFRTVTGGWEQPRRGCPRVRAVRVGAAVTGILLRTRSGDRLLKARLSAGQPAVPGPCGSSCAPR